MTLKAKLWGTTETLIASPFCEVHRIEVQGYGKSSWHHHARKWNAFSIVSGSLWIESRYPGTRKTESLHLTPGMVTTVAPGIVHRFANFDSAEARALEIYYPEGLSEDIVRYSIGGKL
jgi:mannose-6-phosphate isomerase-like protein (cupin superfamily)